MTSTQKGLALGWAQTRALAANTFRESVRSRVFYILMAFAAAMLLFSAVMSLLTIGSRAKIIIDLGLTVTSFITVMTAIFVGIGLIYTEVEKKTIYNVLSKPVGRAHFILGRYLGMMAVLAVNLIVMLALLGLLLLLFKGFTWKIFVAGGFIYLELAILTAIALFFSSVTSPVISAICTLAFYIVGHTSSALLESLAPRISDPIGKQAAIWCFHLLPDLNVLNVTDIMAYDIPIAHGFTARAIFYTAAYVALLLTAACVAFSRRDMV